MAGFDALCDSLRNYLENQNWEPTPIQDVAIEPLLSGEDRLLIAPTGSGKTEAAILPIMSRIFTHGWGPMSVLYVTPLRALNIDIYRRLDEWALLAGFSIGLRHGDTSQAERNKQSKNPPQP